jgi:hypothetical protein
MDWGRLRRIGGKHADTVLVLRDRLPAADTIAGMPHEEKGLDS